MPTPIQTFNPNDLITGLLDAYGFGAATGKKITTKYNGGINLEEYIRSTVKSPEQAESMIADIKSQGVDLTKNYGRTKEDLDTLRGRVKYLADTFGSKDKQLPGGKVGERYFRSLSNLAGDVSSIDESIKDVTFEDMGGLAGMSQMEKIQKIRAARLSGNATPDFTNKDQLSQIFGVPTQDISDQDIKDLQAFTVSDQFKNLDTQMDIIQEGLNQQKTAQERFRQAQEKINAPGYAQNLVNESFKPAELQLDQYYKPQGGAAISQAGQEVGSAEAELGRSGYDRVAVELGRQRGMAYERLGAQKAAAVGDLQKYIDMQNPADVLRFGSQIGQQAQGYQDLGQQRLLAPYQQVFPMMAQSYQLNMMPYSLAGQAVSEPEWYDYALSGLGAAAPIAGALFGGPAGAAGGAAVGGGFNFRDLYRL